MRLALRRGLAAMGAVALATAAVGALHMPFARSLLMRMGGCPVAGRMTAKEMEHARHIALSADTASASAPVRPALGFVLDTTTLADVRAWAAREHVDCDDPNPALLLCKTVPPASVGLDASEGTIDELALGFNQQGRLVNERTLRSHLSPQGAERAAHAIVASLESKLGPAGKSVGTFGAAQLAEPSGESISTVSYRFRDYVADVSAMNLPSSGPLLREHYMSAKD